MLFFALGFLRVKKVLVQIIVDVFATVRMNKVFYLNFTNVYAFEKLVLMNLILGCDGEKLHLRRSKGVLQFSMRRLGTAFVGLYRIMREIVIFRRKFYFFLRKNVLTVNKKLLLKIHGLKNIARRLIVIFRWWFGLFFSRLILIRRRLSAGVEVDLLVKKFLIRRKHLLLWGEAFVVGEDFIVDCFFQQLFSRITWLLFDKVHV